MQSKASKCKKYRFVYILIFTHSLFESNSKERQEFSQTHLGSINAWAFI